MYTEWHENPRAYGSLWPEKFSHTVRTEEGYQENPWDCLPLNFLPNLLNGVSLENLWQTCMRVNVEDKTHTFHNLQVHTRLRTGFGEFPIIPWDVLTYIEYNKRPCYMPVNVSFGHSVMTGVSDLTEEDKREIVLESINSICCGLGLPVTPAIYCIGIPEQHSHGRTDNIFRSYPSEFMSPFPNFSPQLDSVLSTELGCIKKLLALPNGGKTAYYYFPGGAYKGSRQEFEMLVEGTALFCTQMSATWEANFRREIKEAQLPMSREQYHTLMTRMLNSLVPQTCFAPSGKHQKRFP